MYTIELLKPKQRPNECTIGISRRLHLPHKLKFATVRSEDLFFKNAVVKGQVEKKVLVEYVEVGAILGVRRSSAISW